MKKKLLFLVPALLGLFLSACGGGGGSNTPSGGGSEPGGSTEPGGGTDPAKQDFTPDTYQHPAIRAKRAFRCVHFGYNSRRVVQIQIIQHTYRYSTHIQIQHT